MIKDVLFYPEAGLYKSKLPRALMKAGINIHNDPLRPFDVFVLWTYDKLGCKNDGFIKKHKPINYGCYDITKTRVAEIFDDIRIDPRFHSGFAVRKSERQCSNDDTLMECPTQKQDGFIYRRYIETNKGHGYVTYRLYMFDGIKFITSITNSGELFDKGINRTWQLESLDVIPEPRRREIESDAIAFGVHIAELDVLQDVYSGEFYVIDVNNVAGGGGWWKTESAEPFRVLYNHYLMECLNRRYEDGIKK